MFVGIGPGKGNELKREISKEFGVEESPQLFQNLTESSLKNLIQENPQPKTSSNNQNLPKYICCTSHNESACFIPDPKCFRQSLEPSKGKRVIFLTFYGPYQRGKSSIIKLLAGYKGDSIQTGDGLSETTRGIYVYGPYPYNDIRTRFRVNEIKYDDTQLYFFDTEGLFGVYGGGNTELNTFLFSQHIAPYAALSNVLVSVLSEFVTYREVVGLNTVNSVVDAILQENGIESARLMGIITNNRLFKPQNFKEKQKEISNEMNEKFMNNFRFDEFVPLPCLDVNNDIFHQYQDYVDVFEIFGQHLIQQIDESLKFSVLNTDDACKIFEDLVSRIMKENFRAIW